MSHKPAKTTPTPLVPRSISYSVYAITAAWVAFGALTMGHAWRNIPFIALTGVEIVAWILLIQAWVSNRAEQRRRLAAIVERKKLERRVGQLVSAEIADLKSSLVRDADAAFDQIVRNIKNIGEEY